MERGEHWYDNSHLWVAYYARETEVFVVAIHHAARLPGYWIGR